MKLGLIPSISEGGMGNGKTVTFSELKDTAQMAEEMGFDSLWLDDHLIFRFPNEDENGCWECFTFLSGLAAVTSRIQLGPLVACTSFRNPALLAKMTASLDEISQGRFILGLGAGWHEPEYQAFGYPFDRRYARFAEALDIISRLLHGERVTYEGQFYQTHETFLRPRGPSRNGPPIWIGARQPKMLELAARYADGYNTVWHTDPQVVRERFAAFDAACMQVGRDPGTVEHTIGTDVRLLEGDEHTLHPDQPVIEGTAEQVAERLGAMVAAGAQHIIAHVEPRGVVGIERYGRVRAILASEGLTV
jgi:probable F420-dependent oxidoreductase